jgi:hypothetical protein
MVGNRERAATRETVVSVGTALEVPATRRLASQVLLLVTFKELAPLGPRSQGPSSRSRISLVASAKGAHVTAVKGAQRVPAAQAAARCTPFESYSRRKSGVMVTCDARARNKTCRPLIRKHLSTTLKGCRSRTHHHSRTSGWEIWRAFTELHLAPSQAGGLYPLHLSRMRSPLRSRIFRTTHTHLFAHAHVCAGTHQFGLLALYRIPTNKMCIVCLIAVCR